MSSSTILTDIEAFVTHHHMAESTFGREALGDWRLLNELRGSEKRRPRRLWPETEAKVREFMASYTPTPQADAA